MQASWAELIAVIDRIPRDRMDEPNTIGDWSVKDILAHFPGYERWVGATVIAELEGREATIVELYGRADAPSPEEDADDDLSNAWLINHARTQSLDWVLDELAYGHRRLVEAVEACTDADLEDPNRFRSMEGRSFAAVLPNQCWEHHRRHLAEIEAWITASLPRGAA